MSKDSRIALLLIICTAVVARIIILLLYAPWEPAIESSFVLRADAGTYHKLALCILHDSTFCDNAHRTPGYPLFAAIVYSMAGERPWVVLIAHILVDAVIIAVVFRLAMKYFSLRIAIIASILLALDPISLFNSSNLLTDGLFALCFVAAISMYLQGLESKSFGWAAASGAILGFAALVRPSGQFLPLIFFLAALVWPHWKLSLRAGFGTTMVLAFVLSISPWVWRNHTNFGALGIATVQSEAMLNWQVAYFLSGNRGVHVEEIRKLLAQEVVDKGYVDGGNPFENGKIKQEVALKYIKAQPFEYLIATLHGVVKMYANVGSTDAATKLGFGKTAGQLPALKAGTTFYDSLARLSRAMSPSQIALSSALGLVQVTQYVLFAIGLWLCVSQKRRLFIVGFFVVLIAYFSVGSGINAEGRYRIPVAPLYLMLAAVAVDALIRRWHRHDRLLDNESVRST